MYVCMYICMFVCIYVCMHVCMYVSMYVVLDITYVTVSGNAADILAADEKIFQEEHQFDHVVCDSAEKLNNP